MGPGIGRGRVADLTFRVYDCAVHPDWFGTRAHRRIARGSWEADVRITAGGHAVTWRSGERRLTEALAGPEMEWPGAGLLFESPIRREHAASFQPGGGGVAYQTCFEAERVDPEVFDHLCAEMTLDATPGDLVGHFAPADRMSSGPIVRVHVEMRGSGLSVQTFHSFPEERAIVRTQSLFEVVASPRSAR